jgi:hypothetical protein
MQKILRKEQSRDDTMPLLKDEGIKNSLPMQLPIPRLDIDVCRPHLRIRDNPPVKGISLDIFNLMSDHYVWFVDYWLEVW